MRESEAPLGLSDAITFALADGERGTESAHAGLTQGERRIVQLVAEACTNREIAQQLRISERTVERHLSNIFAKLHVRSRAHLTRWASSTNLLLT